MAWPKEDRIRWVEWRRNERLSDAAGRNPGRDLDAAGVPHLQSLEVWLSKERDGLSWQQIVIKHFPQYGQRGHRSAGISKARRVHASVEKALSPPPKQVLRYILDARIEDVLRLYTRAIQEVFRVNSRSRASQKPVTDIKSYGARSGL
jgi:hypothetical protein